MGPACVLYVCDQSNIIPSVGELQLLFLRAVHR